ncbi:trihelix transcription factor GT-3b-like [Prosopis cineraria]|uniref:trihelix transcription factor GT-3b-like n=1 Tax=Prosopis cineraria TaxID=364024 RepID=UPI0024106206|nr:trihelix transcription factor GT-3b-like [Prosopis cineraria]
MDQIHLHHHLRPQHQQQHHHLPSQVQPLGITINVDASSGVVVDRLPQWSVQETKDFLAIRAELDQNFMETKRNKQLWQFISNAMSEKGYLRSPEQCKCKWKNLVTRYKGCETAGPETVRQQFPFYSELQAIFTARMQRMVWAEAAEGAGSSKKKTASDDDEDDNEEMSMDLQGETKSSRKKVKRSRSNSSESSGKRLKEILEEFMRQQIQIESRWMEAFEAREKERMMKEMEWRESMKALENERTVMEQRWREREQERSIREEARAERRDALITALLNKLTRQEM